MPPGARRLYQRCGLGMYAVEPRATRVGSVPLDDVLMAGALS